MEKALGVFHKSTIPLPLPDQEAISCDLHWENLLEFPDLKPTKPLRQRVRFLTLRLFHTDEGSPHPFDKAVCQNYHLSLLTCLCL